MANDPEFCLTDARTKQFGYLVLRLCLGMNIAMHGISRLLAGEPGFGFALAKQFQNTFLPVWSVRAFGFTLPWVEAAIGILLLAGLVTRAALLAGGFVIAILTFGVCLLQQWDVAGIQLIYALAFAALLAFDRYNSFSIDSLRASGNRMSR